MKIQNKHNKRLTWDEPGFVFTIGPLEILEVAEDISKILLRNPNILKIKEIELIKEDAIKKAKVEIKI